MKVQVPSKGEASIRAKIIKKDGTEIDLGTLYYRGPWYKYIYLKISSWFKRRFAKWQQPRR